MSPAKPKPATRPSGANRVKTKKNNRPFVVLMLVVIIAGIGGLAYATMKPSAAARVIDPNAPLPKAEGYVIGSDTAPVEIVMFADFECPGCGQFAVVTEPDVRKRIVETGLARFRFMDFPLSSHANTMYAHNAAACANAQGKFWEMHDELYRTQPDWSALVGGKDAKRPERVMKDYARAIGLDGAAFDRCFENREFEPQIIANEKWGEGLKVSGTPTFIIGNRMLPAGAQPFDVIKAAVDSAIAETKPAAAKKK